VPVADYEDGPCKAGISEAGELGIELRAQRADNMRLRESPAPSCTANSNDSTAIPSPVRRVLQPALEQAPFRLFDGEREACL
jgi:hypothetical protein